MMQNSISESVPRTKNRRIEKDVDAPGTITRRHDPHALHVINSAETLPNPHKLVGSKLEPIIGVLAAQPHVLQTSLIRLSALILDQLATIKLCEASSETFNKPVRDTKTGAALKDKDDAPIMFVPSTFRSKCPIKLSNKFKDDMLMQNLLLEAERDHEE